MHQTPWDSVGQPTPRWAHSSGWSFCSYTPLFFLWRFMPPMTSASFLGLALEILPESPKSPP